MIRNKQEDLNYINYKQKLQQIIKQRKNSQDKNRKNWSISSINNSNGNINVSENNTNNNNNQQNQISRKSRSNSRHNSSYQQQQYYQIDKPSNVNNSMNLNKKGDFSMNIQNQTSYQSQQNNSLQQMDQRLPRGGSTQNQKGRNRRTMSMKAGGSGNSQVMNNSAHNLNHLNSFNNTQQNQSIHYQQQEHPLEIHDDTLQQQQQQQQQIQQDLGNSRHNNVNYSTPMLHQKNKYQSYNSQQKSNKLMKNSGIGDKSQTIPTKQLCQILSQLLNNTNGVNEGDFEDNLNSYNQQIQDKCQNVNKSQNNIQSKNSGIKQYTQYSQEELDEIDQQINNQIQNEQDTINNEENNNNTQSVQEFLEKEKEIQRKQSKDFKSFKEKELKKLGPLKYGHNNNGNILNKQQQYSKYKMHKKQLLIQQQEDDFQEQEQEQEQNQFQQEQNEEELQQEQEDEDEEYSEEEENIHDDNEGNQEQQQQQQYYTQEEKEQQLQENELLQQFDEENSNGFQFLEDSQQFNTNNLIGNINNNSNTQVLCTEQSDPQVMDSVQNSASIDRRGDRKSKEIIRRLQLRDAIMRQEISKMKQNEQKLKGQIVDLIEDLKIKDDENQNLKQQVKNLEQSSKKEQNLGDLEEKVRVLSQEKQDLEEAFKNFLLERELTKIQSSFGINLHSQQNIGSSGNLNSISNNVKVSQVLQNQESVGKASGVHNLESVGSQSSLINQLIANFNKNKEEVLNNIESQRSKSGKKTKQIDALEKTPVCQGGKFSSTCSSNYNYMNNFQNIDSIHASNKTDFKRVLEHNKDFTVNKFMDKTSHKKVIHNQEQFSGNKENNHDLINNSGEQGQNSGNLKQQQNSYYNMNNMSTQSGTENDSQQHSQQQQQQQQQLQNELINEINDLDQGNEISLNTSLNTQQMQYTRDNTPKLQFNINSTLYQQQQQQQQHQLQQQQQQQQ